jgi:hypothetical protein
MVKGYFSRERLRLDPTQGRATPAGRRLESRKASFQHGVLRRVCSGEGEAGPVRRAIRGGRDTTRDTKWRRLKCSGAADDVGAAAVVAGRGSSGRCRQPSKLATRVRFPSPALALNSRFAGQRAWRLRFVTPKLAAQVPPRVRRRERPRGRIDVLPAVLFECASTPARTRNQAHRAPSGCRSTHEASKVDLPQPAPATTSVDQAGAATADTYSTRSERSRAAGRGRGTAASCATIPTAEVRPEAHLTTVPTFHRAPPLTWPPTVPAARDQPNPHRWLVSGRTAGGHADRATDLGATTTICSPRDSGVPE